MKTKKIKGVKKFWIIINKEDENKIYHNSVYSKKIYAIDSRDNIDIFIRQNYKIIPVLITPLKGRKISKIKKK